MKKRAAKPQNDPALPTPQVSAMRLRVCLSKDQAGRASQWLYIRHHFRNHAVSFLTDRRRGRGAWMHRHPALARDGVIEDFSGSDTDAASRWLTETLAATRRAITVEFGLVRGKAAISSEFAEAWAQLTREERDEVKERHADQGRHVLWLLLPRTILDQVLQDLKKTNNKAISDRAENKRRKAQGLKPLAVAGFPQHQKWSFATSLRQQVVAAKNTAFREAWAAGELVIPGLGRLKVREHGYTWPKTPPSLITLARSAGNTWHVSFVCAPGEGRSSRSRRLEREGKVWEPLPVDEHGVPTIEGIDMNLAEKAVSNKHGKLGRKRYLKECASKLRFRNKQLSRRQKGSGRWKKSVRKLGALHDKVANERQHENRAAAQAVADRSAIVCAETLKLGFMLKNKHLAQSIADLGWGQFLDELKKAMAARGHLLLFAGQFDPTTQACPECGFKNTNLKGFNALTIRSWDCPSCGSHHDRDLAAADNIQDFAIERFLESIRNTGDERFPGIHELHPDLVAFIAREGMTAFRRETARESRQVRKGLGLAVPRKRGKALAEPSGVGNTIRL